MARLGITATVNLREKAGDVARGVTLERHLWLPTVDDTSPKVEDLREASAFIGQAMAEGRGVYVHCLSGVGRAATTVAAYLVTTGLTPDQAWAKIRSVRPFVRPSAVQTAVVEELRSQSPV
jgi:protein-tyrosine phosphatase